MLPVEEIRREFPILGAQVNGAPLIYLDNAATTQVPLCVLDRLRRHYLEDNANVHRGIHTLSERSTAAFEGAREQVRAYLNAAAPEEIIFTQGTTDAIHLAAGGLRHSLGPGDSVVVTELEHHSNFLPWQRLCADTGAAFTAVPCPDGVLDQAAFARVLAQKPRVVALTHVSNLTGTVLPVKELTAQAHAAGALVLVDGAQGIRHEPVDVPDLDCDFYCFSGHKILGPTGIGVLYGKRACLERLEPVRTGGGMVDMVSVGGSTYGPLPSRLEAGTPNYAGAIALGEALSYLTVLGRQEVARREYALIRYAEEALSQIEGLTVLRHPPRRAGVISFTLAGVHPYDAASVLDKLGVALRSGTHCAQPALRTFGVDTALRLSPAFYNTTAEIDGACTAIIRTMGLLQTWTRH